MNTPSLVHYFPIATTLICIVFAAMVFRRYRQRGGGTHLLWWSAGILVYGMGTFAESWITLLGWGPGIFKFWYIVGALLGGAPLAQGTVWLLLRRKTARRLSIGLVSLVSVAALCALASPINYAAVDPFLPSGKVFAWQWVRAFSPFINTYAVIFLIGGAIWSAVRFRRLSRADGTGAAVARDRFIGNVLIAVGAILPGLGGGASRMGHTEYLYIGELAGILLIAAGYYANVRQRPIHVNARVAAMVASMLVLPFLVVAPAAAQTPMAVAAPTPVAVTAQTPARTAAQTHAPATLEVALTAPDGSPFGGVAVRLRSQGQADRLVSADAEGVARFADLPAGAYVIVVQVEGFRRVQQPVSLASDQVQLESFRMQLTALSEQVTVAATKTEQDILKVPGEVVVIGRQQLEQVQARSLDDVFRYEPGVEMAESPRRLGQTPNIRGFDDQRILTLRDGARVAQFSSGHRGTFFFDVEDIERIEVVKGPASALYGSGAIGGVISITTRDPGDLLAPRQRVGAQIRSSYSSAYSEMMITPRVFGQSRSGFGWMLSFTGRRNDGTVKLAGGPGQLNQAEEDINAFNARVTVPLSDRDLLRFSLDLYHHSGRSSTNLAQLEVGPRQAVDRTTDNVTANLRYTRSGKRWWDQSVNATFYVDRSDIGEIRPFDDRVDDIRYTTWGFDIRNTATVGDAQQITYGVEVVHERQSATRNSDNHAFFPSGNRLQTGLYLQDQISLLGGKLSIVPGLRYDAWDSTPDNPEFRSQEIDRLSPKIGVSYEFTEGLVGSASYGEGFRAPFFQELYLTDVHFAFPLPGNRFFLALFLPNEDLVPEQSRNVDFGLRFRRREFSVRAAYWQADVEDFIELLPILTTPFPAPGGTQVQLWQAINRQDAELDGFEVGADWAPHADWLLRTAYSRVRGEDNATGEPLLQIPADKLVLGAEWSRPDWGTILSWATRVYSDRSRVPTGVEATDGYTLHDIQASWTPRFRRAVTFHLSVNNLANTEYQNPRFGTPGIGRDVRLGFSLGF